MSDVINSYVQSMSANLQSTTDLKSNIIDKTLTVYLKVCESLHLYETKKLLMSLHSTLGAMIGVTSSQEDKTNLSKLISLLFVIKTKGTVTSVVDLNSMVDVGDADIQPCLKVFFEGLSNHLYILYQVYNKGKTVEDVSEIWCSSNCPENNGQAVMSINNLEEAYTMFENNIRVMCGIVDADSMEFSSDMNTALDKLAELMTKFYAVCFSKIVQGVLVPLDDNFGVMTAKVQGKIAVCFDYAKTKPNNIYYNERDGRASTYKKQCCLFYTSLTRYLEAKPLEAAWSGIPELLQGSAPYINLADGDIDTIVKDIVDNISKINFMPMLHARCSQRLIYAYAENSKGDFVDLQTALSQGATDVRIIPCAAMDALGRRGCIFQARTAEEIGAYCRAEMVYFLKEVRRKILSVTPNADIDDVDDALMKAYKRFAATMYCCFLAIEISPALIELQVTLTPETFQRVSPSLIALGNVSKLSFGKDFDYVGELIKLCNGKPCDKRIKIQKDAKDGDKLYSRALEINDNISYEKAYAPARVGSFMYFGITPDMQKYTGQPEFAWRKYKSFYALTNPGMNNILLGRGLDGKPVSVDLSSNQAPRGFSIFAGSRAGKGVQTLSLLTPFVGIGCPLVYLDCKPDMAKMFKILQKDWAKKTGIDLHLVSYDFQSIAIDDDKEGKIKVCDLSFDGKTGKDRANLEDSTYVVLRGLKVLQTFAAYEHYKSKTGRENDRALCVIDELANISLSYNKAMDDIIKNYQTIFNRKAEAKKSKNAESEEKIDKLLNYLKVLLSLFFLAPEDKKDVGSNYAGSELFGLHTQMNTETLGLTGSKYIFISQQIPSFNTFGATYPKMFEPLVSATSLLRGARATMRNGAGTFAGMEAKVHPQACKFVAGNSVDAEESENAALVNKDEGFQPSGFFAVKTQNNESTSGELVVASATPPMWCTFKPYLTLNFNDYEKGNTKGCVHACLGVVRATGIDTTEVIKDEILRIDAEGKEVKEERIGFQGLCEYMYCILQGKAQGMDIETIDDAFYNNKAFYQANLQKLVSSMAAGTEDMNNFVRTSILGDDGKPVYNTIFEYVNDFTVDGLWSYDKTNLKFRKCLSAESVVDITNIGSGVPLSALGGEADEEEINNPTSQPTPAQSEPIRAASGVEDLEVETFEEETPTAEPEQRESAFTNPVYTNPDGTQVNLDDIDFANISTPVLIPAPSVPTRNVVNTESDNVNNGTNNVDTDSDNVDTESDNVNNETNNVDTAIFDENGELILEADDDEPPIGATPEMLSQAEKIIDVQAIPVEDEEMNNIFNNNNQAGGMPVPPPIVDEPTPEQRVVEENIAQQRAGGTDTLQTSASSDENTFNKAIQFMARINTQAEIPEDLCDKFKKYDAESNYKLSIKITKTLFLPLVQRYFGSLKEIRTIKILKNNVIVLNGKDFRPVLTNIPMLKRLPVNYANNLIKGMWAGVIDLTVIPLKFSGLTVLSIEDEDFAEDVVKPQMRLHRNSSWSKLFHCTQLPRLRKIEIAGTVFTSAEEEEAYLQRRAEKSVFNRIKTFGGKVFPKEQDAPMARFWRHPGVKAVTTGAKYTLGASAVLTAAMALGGWGIVFGGITAGALVKNLKDRAANSPMGENCAFGSPLNLRGAGESDDYTSVEDEAPPKKKRAKKSAQ